MKPLIHERKPLWVILGAKWVRAEKLPHICLACVYLDGILYQTVHDGVGCCVSAEQSMPFPYGMLCAEQYRTVPVTAFHQIEKEMRFVRANSARSPLINDEKWILAQPVQ